MTGVYIARGRCRSGKRWFWFAAEVDYGWRHECDWPACHYGGPHQQGWEDTEDGAIQAMRAAVIALGGADPGRTTGRPTWAAGDLKLINAAKRRNRPPSAETSGAPVDYLFGAWWSPWVDDYTGEHDRRVIPFRITRKTPKRIYYIRTEAGRSGEDPETGYISRAEFEADTRQPPEHGWTRGEAAGEIRTSRHGDHDYHLFATQAAAEDYLFRAERERQRQQEAREPELKQLRMAMADAHPDRGGTSEAFIAARERYKRAAASA